MILIAELSTNHGGDVGLAADMIHAAAEAGADYAKVQSYSLARLNPADPQADWLRQAHLDREAHERLIVVAQDAGVKFLSTPFDVESLTMLRELGLRTFKIASTESGRYWYNPLIDESWFLSWPWGIRPDYRSPIPVRANLTAIPLYPTPLEAVGRATMLDGYSDHAIGLDACRWAIAQGISVLEVHFTIGKGRVCDWDKTPMDLRALRSFADSVETIRTGVSTTFRQRWQR